MTILPQAPHPDPLPASGEREYGGDLQAACWLITDGKIGDEVPLRGVAEAMGLTWSRKLVSPRRPFSICAPWGMADPRDRARITQPHFPALAFAAGRRAVPLLRALKRTSPGTFTVFLGDPHTPRHGADLIWAPWHDRLAGPNVIRTATAPHPYSATALTGARHDPHPGVAALSKPLAVLLIGGPSRHHAFADSDGAALVEIAILARARGFGVAVTASRRTPPTLVAAMRDALAGDPGAFLWDGAGANPYLSMLALADVIVVTADSTNMAGEALAAGGPVYLYEPSGGHPKLAAFRDGLLGTGAVRRWAGRFERWPTVPVDSTPIVAAEVARRFAAFQQGGPP